MMVSKRTALVTGASRGIGLAVARRLAAEGFALTLAARRPEPLHEAAAQLRALGAEVTAVPADVSDEAQAEAVAGEHLSRYDALDVLALCAGTGSVGSLDDYPVRRWDRQFAVNVRSAFLLVQRLLPALRTAAARSEHGARVVAIASITGVTAEPGLAAYSASKAALISLCESITVSEGAQGVTATAVSPGYVETDMTAWMHDRLDPAAMIRAEDVAELVAGVCRLSRTAVVPNIVMTRPGPQLWRA
ncbi:SDR family oxidoreductase [Dactylosporangium salmoneum]|uniref:3-oxoacyl-[acyl-carrier-protein] reductase n=1 Tax=Dactylosporangium salmoneum TaxID=53361 RepID=A0ABP5SYX2_9ACTN